jgi:hypothetical protein
MTIFRFLKIEKLCAKGGYKFGVIPGAILKKIVKKIDPFVLTA